MPSTHFRFPCPSCLHALKVRREYVGKDVQCKHCNVTFRVVVPDDRALDSDGDPLFTVETDAPPNGPSTHFEDTVTVDRLVWDQLQEEVRSLRVEREDRQEARERLGVLTEDLETARHDADHLRAELASARQEASKASGLEAEVSRLSAESESLRGQVEALKAAGLREGMIAVAAAEWGQLHADLEQLRTERDESSRTSALLETAQVELAAARKEADSLRDEAAGTNERRESEIAGLEDENRALKAERARLHDELERSRADALEREQSPPAEPVLPESMIAVERSEWERLGDDRIALDVAREEARRANVRLDALACALEKSQQGELALQSSIDALQADAARVRTLEDETRSLKAEGDLLRAELGRLKSDLTAARQVAERFAELQSEHERLQVERNRLAEDAESLRGQAVAHEAQRERMSALEQERAALQERHDSHVEASEQLRAVLAEREFALGLAAQTHETALAELRREHEESHRRAEEERDAARLAWEEERQEQLRHAESIFAVERSRWEGDLAAAQAELERVQSEAAYERSALKEELAQLRAESDRGRTVLEGSARRIEQLVRDQELQIQQRREVEAALQRLEEAQREEMDRSEQAVANDRRRAAELTRENQELAAQAESLRDDLLRARRTQDDLVLERARAIELLHATQTEQARRVQDLERQLDDAVCAKAQFAPETDETIKNRADLASAREKIQELTELLEASEEERVNVQATLRSLGIRVH
ncbi:MAG: hypothetical protein P4L84_19880 [Isosphaeraceae bacterium]|nr:hypothetical protein [Isosphaeraceae bacterium]